MPSVSVAQLVASVHFSHGSTLVPRKAPIAGCFVPDAKPFPQIALPPLFSLIRRAQPLSGCKKGTGPGGEVQAARAASNRKRVVLGRVLINRSGKRGGIKVRFLTLCGPESESEPSPRRAMCGRLLVGKKNHHVA